MFLFLCTVLFQINDFQLHFNYKTIKQSILLMYTQCKLLQETCVRNEAHSEHINWKSWFSFSSKRRRNGRESHLYETNAKGLSGMKAEMKMQYVFAFPQSKEQAKLTKSKLHAGRCPAGCSCGIPQSLCCLLIWLKHSLHR